MITEYKKGDLLSITNGYLAHGVNCQGKMGLGIAKQIRNKYPIIFSEYEKLCSLHKPENLLGLSQMIPVSNELTIFNMFTQLKYGSDGKRYASLKAIRSAFTYTNNWMNMYDNKVLNIPKIGSGLGGLKWDDVERIINESTPNINVIVYEL